MKFLYLANIRFPTEKAHGLQIAQMCEAFAQGGAQVTLLVARRHNSAEMIAADPFVYYGVARNFELASVPCLDLIGRWSSLDRIAFLLQTFTYLVAALASLWIKADLRAEVYYSRDLFTVLALGLFLPRRARWYEVHQSSKSRIGVALQGWAVRHVAGVVCVTSRLAQEMRALGAQQVMVEHDGFRLERFAGLPERAEARHRLGLPADSFIVGYTGRLQTLNQSKGIDVLVEALGSLRDPEIALCL
ncbi:MAG TPA: hypothetical protein VKQ72_12735, partial [Aggregatilineales bacterium]|nr:hypothetical protein [Aggregatilineales bacterium]